MFYPFVGFPLREEDAFGGGHVVFVEEGAQLLSGELLGQEVNESGALGGGEGVFPFCLQFFETFSPSLEQHFQDVVRHPVVEFAATCLCQ